MADLKISQLNSIVTVVPATDVLPVVQGGTTLKITPKQILESGSPAVLASATITGALTVDTTTLVVNASTDRVGIGTANTFKPLTVQAGSTGAAAINQGLVINSSAAYGVGQGVSYSSLVFSRNRSVDTSSLTASAEIFGGNAVETSSDGGFLGFRTQNAAGALTDRALFNSTGAFVLAGGTTTANGIGVAFPSTQSASSDANCLDDYEEGTWTPVAVSLTVVGSVTYPVATYTKIGRVVYINLKVAASTSSTSTENVTYFTGLPFTPTVNSTVTAVNEQNVGSLGVGLFAANARLYSPTWTAIANATLSGFYYV